MGIGLVGLGHGVVVVEVVVGVVVVSLVVVGCCCCTSKYSGVVVFERSRGGWVDW